MTVSAETTRSLDPSMLRASINLGNPILARVDARDAPKGVSVDLARAFAQRLGLGLELVIFDAACKSVKAVRGEQADIGFFANDPRSDEGIAFTAPRRQLPGAGRVAPASQ
jgi:polar amino acid transport system substrate-binding protein